MNFSARPLAIPDVLLIQARKFLDPRGYFLESYSRRDFELLGISGEFVQDNQSRSAIRGTIRGLHFQSPPHAQAKIVRVLHGSIFDVAVDLRPRSPTFGKWCGVILTADIPQQLLVPRGFAHGFCTLKPDTEVAYKVDDYYAPECNHGIIWNDPDIAVAWPVPAHETIVSELDTAHPRLAEFESPF
jgi:dTDP-4-dehydrorhamnose 3,5-epimerase